MKRICFSALFALFCASLLPSCGGGGGGGVDDPFVSVQAFRSGSKSFSISGTTTIGIIGVEFINNAVGTTITAPPESLSGTKPPSGWEDWKPSTEDVSSCRVRGMIVKGVGGDKICDSTIVYSVSGDKTTGYMEITIEEGALVSDLDALTHWFGCLAPEDIRFAGYSTMADGWVVIPGRDDLFGDDSEAGEGRRMMITSLAGSRVKIWFDFTTGRALCATEYTAVDIENQSFELAVIFYTNNQFWATPI